MRFVSCFHRDRAFAAVVEGDFVVPLVGISELGECTPTSVLASPSLAAERIPLSEATLRPVVPHPGKVICVGLNYLAHVDESRRDIPEYPVLFTKFAQSLTGPTAAVAVPPETTQLDYEAEMVVVIGRPGRRISPGDAMAYVAGYTVANDVTMRDFQYRTHQWLQGKAWDASTPLGPWLVTPDEIEDLSQLELSLTVNGVLRQNASLAQLMFDVPTLISAVSEFAALAPGDLILTGTPGGIGYRSDPQSFLKVGDRVVVNLSNVGSLDNVFVAEGAP